MSSDSAKPHVGSIPKAVHGISRAVGDRIESLLSAEIERWSSLHESLVQPLGSLRDFIMSGKKRLRPAFCYWAFVGAGGDPHEASIVDACAALELLHSFALVHDDVMDDSRQRRGHDAVHVQFETIHEKQGWTGEARRFGEGAAILVGDMAFVYADHLVADAPRAALDVFNEMRVELNVGQYLDIWATASADASVQMAQKIARYKSGKYTVERPMHLGAAMAGRFPELASAYSAYGEPVGEAFQLRDDLLGAFGDATTIGKPVGGDLREGKPTALLAIALDRSTQEDARFLRERYGATNLDDDEVGELQAALERSGARAEVEAVIDRLIRSGIESIDNLTLPTAARESLIELAHFVAGRDS